MFKIKVFIITLFCLSSTHAQDTIRVLFSYGSKPNAKGESRWFGGKHGGHVSISYHHQYASFVPDREVHIFPKKKRASAFTIESDGQFIFDTSDSRYMIFFIPVDSLTMARKDSILQERLYQPGYDYALFGMRCASAAYEILSAATIVPEYSIRKLTLKYFYPKLLRKKMLKLARKNGWKTIYRAGRRTRKWEKD